MASFFLFAKKGCPQTISKKGEFTKKRERSKMPVPKKIEFIYRYFFVQTISLPSAEPRRKAPYVGQTY